MKRRIWIIGPLSMDTVISIKQYPVNGGFAQATSRKDRPGGSASNTAVALASAGAEVHLVSFVGDDEIGEHLINYLSQIVGLNSHVETLPGPSLHALITVDGRGERTVFALEQNRLPSIRFDFKFEREDIVCFPVWRDEYLKWLKQANLEAGLTVVGSRAILNSEVIADIAIGSESDADVRRLNFDRIRSFIITQGVRGSKYFDARESIHLPAFEVDSVDATGAGDAYLAGILLGLAEGSSIRTAMGNGTKWAAMTVSTESSVPPPWSEVCLRFGS